MLIPPNPKYPRGVNCGNTHPRVAKCANTTQLYTTIIDIDIVKEKKIEERREQRTLEGKESDDEIEKQVNSQIYFDLLFLSFFSIGINCM